MPSAIVIGEGTLPVQCAQLLTMSGWEVMATCSPDERPRDWASQTNVTHYASVNDLAREQQTFDYLFSVVNYKVLPDSLITAPRYLAVNYHDAPLPRYAGIRATMWALINGEKEHGITWHVMTTEIDAGDILKQVTFPIGDEDTSFQLNLRCYYAAIAAFRDLIGELENGTAVRIRQDLSQRTYFPKKMRPENDCLISWEWPADRIARFCRALDFGPMPNAVGQPKALLDGQIVPVLQACTTGRPSTEAPGTVLERTAGSFRVATMTEDLVISPQIPTA